ncbi:OPT oligopeptide transporter [Daedaleopsis nitida]|nr:OPT oligopeptide transporter [Daedaleopsis nitida]
MEHGEGSSHDSLNEKKHIGMDEYEVDTPDITRPFPPDPDEMVETHQLTIRALVVGSALGAVVGASNIYLGLKTGFTFGPQLFGAIFGFAIIKPLSKAPGIVGKLFGGSFGPKENCTVQSAATAAGGIGILFVSAIPAMYRLGLLSELPKQDIGKLIALAACSGFFGVFFVIPLRRYYIVKQKLTFPTPAATAVTIRALHNGRTGAMVARKKSLALLYSFIIVFVYKVVSGYAPGVLFDWHIGWTLYRLGFTSIISLDNYGWYIEFTPAFFGAGMLSGLNASWSFFGGSILAWGIIAPSLVKNGLAVGLSVSDEFPLVSYNALSFENQSDFTEAPSPRYWLLWPGILMMLCYSFTDLGMNSGFILSGTIKMSNINPVTWFRSNNELDDEDEDQTPMEDRVPTLWWTTGLAASIVMCCAILATLFHMNVGEAILSLILGFAFSFVGVQSAGTTDVNPVTAVAKASQLIFGGIGKGAGLTINAAETVNLTAGIIAAGSAAQATDMTGDLKTGYLLRAKPKNQFVAQLTGAVVAIFLNVGLFILFTTASPCILSSTATECTYAAPSISAWVAVAEAVALPSLPIPKSAGFTAIGLGIFTVIMVIAKHLWIPKKYWIYIPNWNAVGLAFVAPQIPFSIAMAAGSIFNYFWQRRNPVSFDMYMFAISAGMLAGEGLGGVLQALLAVAKVDGSLFGTAIGCPGLEFCG